MKEKIKKLGEVILIILFISFVITNGMIETSPYQSFFEVFPKVLRINLILGSVIWLISKFYQLRKSEITNRDEFIKEIDEDLENLENHGNEDFEDFEELKEEITNIRKRIESFTWNPRQHQEEREYYKQNTGRIGRNLKKERRQKGSNIVP